MCAAEISTITELPKNIVDKVKSEATTAPTKEGITNQVVGFALGIPISMFYDWLYEMVAAKVITNVIARHILKIATPLAVGLVFQFTKLPFGNIIAGTGYAVAIISAGKILYEYIKEKLGKGTSDKAAIIDKTTGNETEVSSEWGVQ